MKSHHGSRSMTDASCASAIFVKIWTWADQSELTGRCFWALKLIMWASQQRVTHLSSQLIFDKLHTFDYVPASCSSSAPPCFLPLQLVCACLGGADNTSHSFSILHRQKRQNKRVQSSFFTFLLLRLFLRPRKQSRREFVLKKIKRAAAGGSCWRTYFEGAESISSNTSAGKSFLFWGKNNKRHSHKLNFATN